MAFAIQWAASSLLWFACLAGFLLTAGGFRIEGVPVGAYMPVRAACFMGGMFWLFFQLLRMLLRRAQHAGYPACVSLAMLLTPAITLAWMGADTWDATVGPSLGLLQILWVLSLLALPEDAIVRLWAKLAGVVRKPL